MHPILFHLGNFPVYSYGFMAAAAVFASYAYAQWAAPRFGLPRQQAGDLVFLIFVSGIIGARFFFVAQNFEQYRGHFWRSLWIREGGLVFYGGFLAAFLAGLAYVRLKKLSLSAWLDFFAPALALAHAIGRVGCYLHGCCWGAHLPVQLLEATALLFLAVFLFMFLRQKHRSGDVFISYVLLYSFMRFWLEFLRGDQMPLFSLTLAQWISLILFSGILCYRLIKK